MINLDFHWVKGIILGLIFVLFLGHQVNLQYLLSQNVSRDPEWWVIMPNKVHTCNGKVMLVIYNPCSLDLQILNR